MTFLDIIPKEDLKGYQKASFIKRAESYGKTPALIVVDMTYAFIDPKYPLANGEMGIRATKSIGIVLREARSKFIPIIFTKIYPHMSGRPEYTISKKRMVDIRMPARAYEIVKELKPRRGEHVITKGKASAFFGTHLLSILINYNVDTVIITGATTSGCVRATVVDAASYNYTVIVPEECTADRAILPHNVNLFDMHMKYADVIPLSDVITYLKSLNITKN